MSKLDEKEKAFEYIEQAELIARSKDP